jgi:hypothetical protein
MEGTPGLLSFLGHGKDSRTALMPRAWKGLQDCSYKSGVEGTRGLLSFLGHGKDSRTALISRAWKGLQDCFYT